MAFVNEYITPEDRERHQLEAFEKRFFSLNPQGSWVIDRDRDIFLRIIRPEARKNEPGDPDARFEDDFHFHWKGFDFLISTRCGLSEEDMIEFPGHIFHSKSSPPSAGRQLRFYVRHIGELKKPTPSTPSALIHQKEALFQDLEDALGISWAGICMLSPENINTPRHAKLKFAPNAEVSAQSD